MDVSKAPPLDPKAGFAPTDAPTLQRSTLSAAAAATAPLADQVHMQPLDAAAALQILVAEVRAGLGLLADAGNPSIWLAETVAAWRNVPQAVVDVAKETRALVASLLSDAPPSPIWFRPEWLGLAPTVERFWRRRRLARRGLTDPDMRPSGGTDAADADAGFVDDKSR